MERADIEHLASLARIALREHEAEEFAIDFNTILSYVAQVTAISATGTGVPTLGVHANVLRDDTETHQPGAYTDVLLAAAPERLGAYIHVKKILGGS